MAVKVKPAKIQPRKSGVSPKKQHGVGSEKATALSKGIKPAKMQPRESEISPKKQPETLPPICP
jgi:hypothetical protein